MNCLNCGFLNPPDASFCQECGKPLEQVCSNCATPNPPGAKYCKRCGASLANPPELEVGAGEAARVSDQPRFAGQDAALPAEKPRLRTSLAGERRIVTVLFADVVESTALAERFDPEDWTGIMNRAFELLTPVITRYEGTVARLMGDGLLAFFGAPQAHEDDPLRAAYAALDLVETTRQYAEELRSAYGIDFAIRVGLNTGPVVVGEVGSRQVFEYTAMGDAVNLAARLQTAARPLSVLVSEALYKTLAQAFEGIDRGMATIRGKNEPVHVFELTRPKIHPVRQRSGVWQDSPLVGREAELSSLVRLGQVVQAGLGRVCIVVGEPGIGKSRLVAEWKSTLAGSPVDWAEGHCLTYGENLAYHLVIDLLHSVLDRSQAAEIDGRALQTLTQELFGENVGDVFPYLANLLSIDLEKADRDRLRFLDPEALQSQYIHALQTFLKALAARRPLILFLEDVHWADPSSIEVIGKLIPLSLEAPLLFCILTRPDHDSPGWELVTMIRQQYGSSLAEVSLQPLTAADSSRLATHLIGVDILPPGIEEIILSRAEGNPLFVEELIRMLLDRGILVRQDGGWVATRDLESLDLPDTLQSLLLSRIDRLPDEARSVLRTAAVIGRQFSVRVLEQVFQRLEQAGRQRDGLRDGGQRFIPVQLSLLEAAGLISLTRAEADFEYSFHHTLVHDAAYHSLLKAERQGLHQVVGEVLEEIYSGSQDEHASLLAEHFWQAGDRPRAERYTLLAADSAARAYAIPEAIAAYTRALALVGEDPPVKIRILQSRGDLLEITGDFNGARSDQEAALAAARTAGDQPLEWQSLINLGKLWAAVDYRTTGRYFHQALRLARQLEDRRLVAHSLNRVGNYYTNIDQPRLSQRYLGESLAIFTELEDEAGIAETTDLSGMASGLGGDMPRASTFNAHASDIFERLDDRRGLSSSLATTALASPNYESDMMISSAISADEGVRLAEKAVRIAAEIGWRAGEVFALAVLGNCLISLGDYDQAAANLAKGMKIVEEIQHRQWEILIHSVLGDFYMELLAGDQAQSHFEKALALSIESRSIVWIRTNAGYLATTLVSQGALDAAAEILERHFPTKLASQTLGQRQGWCARADLALAQNNPTLALEITDRLIHQDANYRPGNVIIRVWIQRSDAVLALARAARDPAQKQDLLVKAEGILQEVLQEVQKLNYSCKLWRIFSRQAQVYAEQGRRDLAEQSRSSSQKSLLELADHISDKDLLHNFLAAAFRSGAL